MKKIKSIVQLFYITAAAVLFSGCPYYYVPESPDPQPPSNPAAVPFGSNEILLTWDAVEKATAYYIYRSDDSVTFPFYQSVNFNSYLDTTVLPGITYYYKIKTVRESFLQSTEYSQTVSAASEPDTYLTLQPPVFTVSAGSFSRQAVLTWNAVSGASKYEIYGAAGSQTMSRIGIAFAGEDHTVLNQDVYTYTVCVPNKQTYYFRIRAAGTTGTYSMISESISYSGIEALNTSQIKADPLYFNESQTFRFPETFSTMWFRIDNTIPTSGQAELRIDCLDDETALAYTLVKNDGTRFTVLPAHYSAGSFETEIDMTDNNSLYYISISLREPQSTYNDYRITVTEAE